MSAPLLPNTELVARAWLLAAVTGLTGKVATTLPDPPWTDNEFVQIMSVGGTPDPELARFNPAVTVNCYAMVPGSTKPPWGRAAQLAMRIWQATLPVRYSPDPAVELDLPDGYGRAIVQSVSAVSDVRRLPSDPSQYAVYNLDILFSWVPASVVVP
jgi:hypothetical protein